MSRSFSALDISRQVIASHIHEGDICIDATAGRGNDTVFMAELAGETGHVIAFDIQEDAVNSTRELLEAHGYSHRADVLMEGHQNMKSYAEPGSVSCITFNLGWLPMGDHSIHTNADTSIEALSQSLELLKVGGLISLIVYYGRDTGFEEKSAVMDFVKSIDSRRFTVITAEFSNRPNCPPIPIFITRDE
ncbi:MAG: class I SAM-dependent methyltransferase [Huintestinicola sp.]